MIEVFDNIVPASLMSKLEEALTHDDTEWNLALSCGGWHNMDFIDKSNVVDTHQMYHALVSDNAPKSQITSLSLCLLFFLEHHKGIAPGYILRVKANLLFPMVLDASKHHPPHIDTSNPNALSMIYYVTDSDGPTRMFDNTGNVIQTIDPKRGRIVLFSSNTPHASSCPINSSKRLVINFVFEPA